MERNNVNKGLRKLERIATSVKSTFQSSTYFKRSIWVATKKNLLGI